MNERISRITNNHCKIFKHSSVRMQMHAKNVLILVMLEVNILIHLMQIQEKYVERNEKNRMHSVVT